MMKDIKKKIVTTSLGAMVLASGLQDVIQIQNKHQMMKNQI